MSPGRRQAIIWTNDGILIIGHLGTKLNEILIEMPTFSFKKIHLKRLAGKWLPFYLVPNVLKSHISIPLSDVWQELTSSLLNTGVWSVETYQIINSQSDCDHNNI